MQDAFVVCCFDAGDDLSHDRRRSLRRHCAFATQQVIKRFAFNVLHHEKKHAVGTLAEVSYVYDIRVPNRGGGTSLAFEARDSLAFLEVFVIENVGADSLYRDAASQQVLIAGEIDLAHRAAAKSFFE